MARSPKYEIDNKKKVVKADIAKLNEKEIKKVKNYIALGYSLEEVEPVKIFTKENILAFIKDNKIDFDLKALMNEKNEKGNKKGFVYALKVFRNQYEEEFKKYMAK